MISFLPKFFGQTQAYIDSKELPDQRTIWYHNEYARYSCNSNSIKTDDLLNQNDCFFTWTFGLKLMWLYSFKNIEKSKCTHLYTYILIIWLVLRCVVFVFNSNFSDGRMYKHVLSAKIPLLKFSIAYLKKYTCFIAVCASGCVCEFS